MNRAEENLIREHLPNVFAVLHQITGSFEDAQELTQEVFICALQGRGSQNPGWAMKRLPAITAEVAAKFIRSHRVCDTHEAAPGQHTETQQRSGGGSDQRRTASASGGLDFLSVQERLTVLLHDGAHVPASDLARSLHCSVGAVRACISKARVRFRQALQI